MPYTGLDPWGPYGPPDDLTCPDCGDPTPHGGRCCECAESFDRECEALNRDLKDDPEDPHAER